VYSPGNSPGNSPDCPREFAGELTLGEFAARYEAVEEKGRCFMKGVLYPLGVRNVVRTIEMEVVLVKA
jgi:hypothetical protein